MKKIVSTAAIATLALAAFAAPTDIAERTEAKTFAGADGAVFRYRWAEKLPDDGSKVPLVIFLHGAGERGTNNVAQLRQEGRRRVRFQWLDGHHTLASRLGRRTHRPQRACDYSQVFTAARRQAS